MYLFIHSLLCFVSVFHIIIVLFLGGGRGVPIILPQEEV